MQRENEERQFDVYASNDVRKLNISPMSTQTTNNIIQRAIFLRKFFWYTEYSQYWNVLFVSMFQKVARLQISKL